MISFFVPGNPVALKRHRTVKTKKGGHRTYDSSAKDKADFLAMALQHRPETPINYPVSASLKFSFSRPKSHYGTGKNARKLKTSAPFYHTNTPDADNLVKFVCDALNGVFWTDDSVISQVQAQKIYSDVPGITISIQSLTKHIRHEHDQPA